MLPSAFVSEVQAQLRPELLTTEPHVAGTQGDIRQIERIRSAFESMGLATQVEWFRCLLARPEKALLEIVAETHSPDRLRIFLLLAPLAFVALSVAKMLGLDADAVSTASRE